MENTVPLDPAMPYELHRVRHDPKIRVPDETEIPQVWKEIRLHHSKSQANLTTRCSHDLPLFFRAVILQLNQQPPKLRESGNRRGMNRLASSYPSISAVH